MKTHPHDIIESRKERDENRAAASKKYQQYSNEWFAEFAILNLDRDGDSLPDCYNEPYDFFYDFWPDLPWNDNAGVCAKLILKDERFPAIAEKWMKNHYFDLRGELLRGIEQLLDGEEDCDGADWSMRCC